MGLGRGLGGRALAGTGWYMGYGKGIGGVFAVFSGTGAA
jgi:hypothetical protein